MQSLWSRIAAVFLRARLVLVAAFLLASVAHAVVIRGRVTTPLGGGVARARVQLIRAGAAVAETVTDANGNFEIRFSDAGRFTLLTSAAGFLPAVGEDFYGGSIDVVNRDVTMARNTVRQELFVTANGLPTPLPQLTVPVSTIAGSDLATRFDVVQEMRQTPGAYFVQSGQAGGVTSLFLRGGQSDATKVTVDGVSAEDVGGRFDWGTVSSTGVAGLEINRSANSALYGSNALTGVVALTTPRGTSLKPVLLYSGDAGNLHTYRNEASLSGTYYKLDYLAAFSRFDTSNALAFDRYHSATTSANVGYNINARWLLRGTVRNAVSATGVPGAHDFYGISANAKQGDQDIYAQGTMEYRTLGDWHNLVRYGVARKREQFNEFGFPGAMNSFGTYYGNVVTIRGANGYKVTGQAAIGYDPLPANYLIVNDRDELYYQSDYTFAHHWSALFGFRYEDERGAYRYPLFLTNESLERVNFQYTGQVQGDIKNRVFLSFGGAVEKNHLFGTRGTPRLGIAWAAVKPSDRKFHGTRVWADVSRGVQEPNLNAQFGALYTLLQQDAPSAITKYNIHPIQAQESRTYDIGVDQNVFSKLTLKAGYFHSEFDHEIEYVGAGALKQYFGIPVATDPACTPAGDPNCTFPNFYGAYLNSLTYRAQGAEFEAQYQPTYRIFLRGGYTYLAPLVQRSFSSDAVGPSVNPLFPGTAIGVSSPLVGSRPFRRAPNTAFLSAQYTHPRFTVAFRGAFSGKSDDSTYIDMYSTPTFDNTMLLPNRNLDFGYAKLDLGGTMKLGERVTAFAQLENLANQQHIGPIGYPGLPLTVRAGLKVKVGGD